MRITETLIGDYIACRHKAAKSANGRGFEPSAYERIQTEIRDEYRVRALDRLRERREGPQFIERPDSLEAALRGHRLLIDVQQEMPPFSLTIDAIKSSGEPGDELIVVKCLPTEPQLHDKLTLACIALLLEREVRIPVATLEFVHGPRFETRRVALKTAKGPTKMSREAHDVLRRIESDIAASPPPRLNRH